MSSPLPEEAGPTFDPRTHWCPRHLAPFRDSWPTGRWVFATLGLMQEMLHRREILTACGWEPATADREERRADVRMLDRVLREYAPLCCYVGDEVSERWTGLALGPIEEYRAAHDALAALPAPIEDETA
jgi:hypothetical protein